MVSSTLRTAFFLLLQASCCFSQNDLWQVFGHVHDDGAEPVAGARVIADDSIQVNADGNGFFQIKLAQRPRSLTVRSVGYFPKRITLDAKDFKGRKGVVNVTLLPQVTEMREVDITAKKVETLIEENFQTNILDFDFLGPHLVLLVKEKKRSYLQLMSDKGVVLQGIALEGEPRYLHRSCFGDLIVVHTTHVNEITFSEGGRMDTFPRFGIRKFEQVVASCAQENQGYLYYAQQGTLNQALTYWYVTPDGEQRMLVQIIDEEKLEEGISAYFSMLDGVPFTSRGPTATTPAVNATTRRGDIRNISAYANFPLDVSQLFRLAGSGEVPWISLLQRIENDSVYAPLFKIGQTLVLFDHLNGRLWQFDPTFQVNTTRPISYHRAKGWLKELLQDHDARQVIYAHFAPSGRHDLRKINLRDGSVEREYPLAEVDHLSQNFKVRGGQLYYLGQPDVNTPNHKLYKVNIAQKSK